MLHVQIKRSLCAGAALCVFGPLSAQAAPAARVVTLITGDRVSVDAAGNASVQPAQGRRSVPFQVLKANGHTHVIPSDALGGLHAGQLDPRLFDVTELIASGYDDRATTPVIVTGAGMAASGKPGASALAAAAPQAAAGRQLPVVDGLAVAATGDGSFWRDWTAASASLVSSAAADGGATKLWLDGRLQLSVEDNLKQIGADVAHERGLLGDGVKVAVIDSGIDATHRDLSGQVSAHKNFISDEEDDRDQVGHGTHVASIIAGTGAQSKGRFQGIAPNAKLIDAKACGQKGCTESALLEAMEWAAQQGARVINMSLGARDSSKEDLIEQAVNKLSKKYGVLFVVAAGNDYEFGLTVGSPASAEAALAVGALTSRELPAAFSQRGRLGELSIKPELVAPGVDITAALSHFIADQKGPLRERPDAEGYATASGTSMAAPHVSGAAALLSQQHPDWKGDQLKAVLMGSAKLLEHQTALEQGAGLVDIPAALDLELRAEPAAVSFGTQAWPHDDDSVREQAVTLYNTSDSKVTLDLKLEASGPDGASADGVFSLSDDKLTIDAHGKAKVTLSADTRKGTDGLLSGALLASSDGTSLHVPFAIQREVESYDLELRFTGRDGKPRGGGSVFASVHSDADVGLGFGGVDVQDDGTAKLRLPRAQYLITAFVSDPVDEAGPRPHTMLIYPQLQLDADAELAFDARKAKQVQIDSPLAEAERRHLSFHYDTAHVGTSASVDKDDELFSGRLGPDLEGPQPDVKSSVSATWLPPGAAPDSAYQFNFHKFFPGELRSGYEGHTEVADYIRVDTKFARGGMSLPATFVTMGLPADPKADQSGSGIGLAIALPSERRIYYIDDPALAWRQYFQQRDLDADLNDEYEGQMTLESGKRHSAQWNQAVFAPVASGFIFASTQRRYGDKLSLHPSLIGDSEGRAGESFSQGNAHARLFRDGALLKEFDSADVSAEVPPEAARYRVEAELVREYAELSTQVELAWEFVSETNADSATLPVSYIRFRPVLDQDSAAQQGGTFELPITVEPQESSAADTASLSVDVSYDDGKTWAEAPVTGQG